MGFVNRVNIGDTWAPSADTINSLADRTNGLGRDGERSFRKFFDGAICVPIVNASDVAIGPYTAVTLLDYANGTRNLAYGVPYDGSYRQWGIAVDYIPPNSIGDCVVGGILQCNVNYGQAGLRYVAPSFSDPTKFVRVPFGNARIVSNGHNGLDSIIQFCDGYDSYCGFFKVLFSSGTASQGGRVADEIIDYPNSIFIPDGRQHAIGCNEKGLFKKFDIGPCNPVEESSSSDSESSSSTSSSSSDSESDSSSSSSDSWIDDGVRLMVVDGMNPASEYAGEIFYGNSLIPVHRTGFAVNESGYVCCEFNDSDGKIFFSHIHPRLIDGTHIALIARVYIDNGACSVVQEHHGAIVCPHSGNSIADLAKNVVQRMFGMRGW